MKVILKETINTLGVIGSEVEVADGYARNFLLPQKKAVPSTSKYKKMMEQKKVKFEVQRAKEKKIAEQMAEKVKSIKCVISAKTNEDKELYGSVTALDIINALSSDDIKIEKRMILLKEPIKSVGEYKVPVNIYKGVEPEITVKVVSD